MASSSGHEGEREAQSAGVVITWADGLKDEGQQAEDGQYKWTKA